ncbi:SDR family NAD(P)-dependent oxidoreductase [Burkholderia cenocepacia]|jgi:short-subunit dehydrogenase|uniref:Exported dehydrogenase n=1 Tax=Burkholderia cenocepacia (strain ATCC BAA-245 / DSM 16553 / LMG 16656 / NCTC 13227 / J2315 / CF5610) TaxID=216591 RepID=B4ELQ0_BURCJ|nr:SDR family NAD(P)-dependent oxidoreductase [Burkholderia cenocepacia]KIS52766.1 short chain dehydrogenase family protein [Burkholderia cepacia]AMU11814.1 short-chain dehydrogenase [Burkholderia cenocepacia]EPZ89436.1 KR domain protein [Burkholderia cenocepacia K56-2Valvano]ERI28634.1 KR domain protein [Burkholderia cenocepacia BC7]KKI80237.1 short-chain dehydrogenase [Burkholderia cenocepacia]
MKGFSGKVAAITGAGSGMGRSLAVELARRGCAVALADVSETGLAGTAALCAQHGVHVSKRRLDVADRDAVFAWADFVRAEHGKVNLIFNNAGVSLAASAETARLADLEWIVGINFWGVVHGTQAFLPHLRASGDGHVVNTSSLFGLVAMPTQSAYNATKFAVRGFTEALRMELELDGAPVSATCVHPGGVATSIVDASRVDTSIHALTGQDEATHRRQANRLINATTADEAARQILAGVERNARRVLVGADARRLDRIARLLGAGYQWLVLRHVRRARARNLERAPAPAARPITPTKDPA